MSGNTHNFEETQKIDLNTQKEEEMRRILLVTYDALRTKGYNPISQIVGYILTEDPTYITSYNNARSLIRKIDRFELLQILVRDYIHTGTLKDTNGKKE